MLLKREGRSQPGIKVVGGILLLVSIVAMLGGCAWIHDWLNPNQTPVAVISANPTSGEAPLEVSFDASESYDPDGDEISYEGDFGDGKTEVGQVVQHTFATPKNYTVQLTALDDERATGTSALSITVSVETTKDTVGPSGGTVVTNQGSSVDVPPGTFAGQTQVSISELAESPVQFNPGVKALGNGVLVTLSESNINPSAFVPQVAAETTPGTITISVPLPPSAQEPSPDKREGFLLTFSSNGKSMQMVVGIERSGNAGKVSIPTGFITEFASGSSGYGHSATVNPKALFPMVFQINATPFETHTEPVASQLYRVSSSSGLTPLDGVENESIIPIILIHGYKILGVDEVVVKGVPASTRYPKADTSSEERIKRDWQNFITFFYNEKDEGNNTLEQVLNTLIPGKEFRLYAYRWNTDEGISNAAWDLAQEVQQHFGTRPLILIGHSAGGVVARESAENTLIDNALLGEQALGVITLASPHLGATPAVKHLFLLPKSGDVTTADLEPESTLLTNLNNSPKYNYKLIAYGGYFSSCGEHLKRCCFGRLFYKGQSDGVVALNSALLSADTSQTICKSVTIVDYDHFDMLHDKSNNKYTLYTQISEDLKTIAEEAAARMNQQPVVSIISPQESTYRQGETIAFQGEANDPEDGPLLGSSLFWTSSIYGEIGTGESFDRNDLAVGTHTITLIAVDSQGEKAEDSVTITIIKQPDLKVRTVYLSKSSAQVGDTVSVTFTVENKGGPLSRKFQNRVFLSTKPYGGQKIFPDDHDFPMSLEGTSSKTETVEVTIPQMPSGNWYIAVYADGTSVIEESDENNNIDSASLSIGTPPPSQDTTSPTTPTSLRATAVSPTQIDLVWDASTDNVGVTGYKIYRDGAFLKEVSTTSYSDTGLTPSTRYCYKVSAFDEAGNESNRSSQACTTTLSQTENQPPVIDDLRADPTPVPPGGQSRISVSAHDPDGDPLTYRWSTTGGRLSGTTGSGDKIWTAPNTSGTYTVTLSVTDNKPGHSPRTQSVKITVVAGLTITTHSLPSGKVGESYQATLAATGGTPPYRWSLASGRLPPGLNLDAATAVISSTPTASGTFNFTLQVQDSSTPKQTDQQALSLTIAPQPVREPDPPQPRSPGSSSQPGPQIDTLTPTLRWDGVSNADSYALAISVYPYGSGNIVYNPQQLYGTSHAVPSGELEYGKRYCWNMQSRNSAGLSEVSRTLFFQVHEPERPPDPPRPLSPGSTSQPGPEIEDLTPTLRWETGSGADYCALAISEYPHGTNYIVYNPQQLYGTSITVPSGVLEQGKRYCWNMQSRNSAGLSEVSRTLFFQIPQPPSTPTERLTNGSFSQGTSGWTLGGDFWAGTNYSHYRTSPGYAAGGVTSAGQPKNNAVGWMYQAVTIPSGATSVTLSFYYNITSQETSTTAHDFLNATIQDSAGHYLGSVRLLSNRDQASLGVYRRVSADVTSYRGRTIRVNFLATTNATNPTVFRIDDVSLMSDG